MIKRRRRRNACDKYGFPESEDGVENFDAYGDEVHGEIINSTIRGGLHIDMFLGWGKWGHQDCAAK